MSDYNEFSQEDIHSLMGYLGDQPNDMIPLSPGASFGGGMGMVGMGNMPSNMAYGPGSPGADFGQQPQQGFSPQPSYGPSSPSFQPYPSSPSFGGQQNMNYSPNSSSPGSFGGSPQFTATSQSQFMQTDALSSGFMSPQHQMPMQQPQHSTQLINNILEAQRHHCEQLDSIRMRQKQLFANPVEEAFHVLCNEEKQLATTIETYQRQLEELLTNTLLSTNELHRIEFLQTELSLQHKQLEVFYVELQQLEPFPNVMYKGQQLTPGELKLRLLTGANVQVESLSPVKGAMIIDSHPAGKSDAKMIANDTQLMDQQYMVTFPLSFLEGTRKAAVHLRFGLEVKCIQNRNPIENTVWSDITKPFVVMTNQKQWEACERTLLLRDAFGDKLEIAWLQFANALQRQFVRATKQDPTNPSRCLSQFDFAYVKNKFFADRPIVHQKDYDTFWGWYGKCLQVIRFQRHILQLWRTGLVYGFMTREDVDAALGSRSPGHFVIRFSERHAGQFGIAYVGAETPWRIKHYLVQPNGISQGLVSKGSSQNSFKETSFTPRDADTATDTAAAKFTLPDFCRDKGQFSTILQFSLNQVTGRPQFQPYAKDVAFESYYSRRVGGDTSGSGYEPLS